MDRKLSLTDATLLVSGSMIGSGIFIVSADMSRTLGSAGWVLTAWILSGFMTLCGALGYGELAGMMPKAGGQYVYIQRAFGRLTAFVYGWSVFTVIQTGVIAAVAVAFAMHLGVFIPVLGEGEEARIFAFSIGDYTYTFTFGKIVAVTVVLFLTWLNGKGVQEGKIVQRIFTLSKLIALFGLILCGLYFATKLPFLHTNLAHAWDSATFQYSKDKAHLPLGWTEIGGMAILTAMGAAMVGSLFSSDAWNGVTFISGEIDNPTRNIPRSLFLGTLIVTVIYVLVNVAYMCLLPVKGSLEPGIANQGISFALNNRVGAAATKMVLGIKGEWVIAALIMISTFGCINGIVITGGRLYKAMADDGLFFKKASKLNRNLVPGNAMWIQAVWGSVLCISGSYGNLLDYCIFASLLFYIVTILGLFKLRITDPNAERPYRTFGYPIIPAIYILLAAAIAIDIMILKWEAALAGLIIVSIGIPVYYFFKKKHNLTAPDL